MSFSYASAHLIHIKYPFLLVEKIMVTEGHKMMFLQVIVILL